MVGEAACQILAAVVCTVAADRHRGGGPESRADSCNCCWPGCPCSTCILTHSHRCRRLVGPITIQHCHEAQMAAQHCCCSSVIGWADGCWPVIGLADGCWPVIGWAGGCQLVIGCENGCQLVIG